MLNSTRRQGLTPPLMHRDRLPFDTLVTKVRTPDIIGNHALTGAVKPLNGHLDVVTFNFDLISFKSQQAVFEVFTGADVILPHVPWTRDNIPFQRAFAKGPALVQAGIIRRVDFSVNVKKRDGFAAYFKSYCDH